MYEKDPSSDTLRTGDVVNLSLDDFKKIARHESMHMLFKDFEKNQDYSAKLWAILNKSCDMVHSPNTERFFKGNLFLAPLQGLKRALKKEVLGSILYSEENQSPFKIFIEKYKDHLIKKAKIEAPRQGSTPSPEYNKKIESLVKPLIGKIKEFISEGSSNYSHPEEILSYLKDSVSENHNYHSTLIEFEKSKQWKDALANFDKFQLKIKTQNSKIILRAQDAKNKIANLTLNQLDSQGIFYYEPHTKLSLKEHDLSYLIQLEDIITLKINEDSQKEGTLFHLLIDNRQVMLTRNFSDRLLNIMGNFFSKIGTKDVRSDFILALYKEVYPEDFFLDVNKYKERKLD